MFPPIAQVIAASSAVTSLLGTAPIRFWPFGDAPRDESGVIASATPYAVWQISFGTPENYLAQVPDIDSFGTQIDTYAANAAETRAVAQAIRDALEPSAYVTSWNGEFRDGPTGLYRYSFTVDWLTER